MNKLFAVDVETTGLDPKVNSIVSIGAVDIEVPERSFYKECRPFEGAIIEDAALHVNGFTREDFEKQLLDEAMLINHFFDWLDQQEGTPIMVAHNSAFDKSFIAEAANRAGFKNPFSFRTIDIHSIVYMHLLRTHGRVDVKSLSLNECLKSFGLDKEPDPHNALTGAKCNQQLFKKVQIA